MAFVEGCKHSIDVSIPVDIIASESEKVAADIQAKARIPGFRPGKAPLSIIRKQFEPDIRQKVVENLIPKYFEKQVEQEHLKVVSRPDFVDVHFTPGEPLVFKAEFEVAPEFELGEFRGIEVPYREPSVSDEDVASRLEAMREEKATFVNVDPRPLEVGDFAVLSLQSIAGTDEPVKSDELTIELGGKETLHEFTENLTGVSPGEIKEFDVVYPEEHGQARFAGKTIKFRVTVKGVRRKDLPELNDELAKEFGDNRDLAELRDKIRKGIRSQREYAAQQVAKNKLVDSLVDAHEFAVPQVYVDRQLENRISQRLQSLADEGVDVSQFQPDWGKLREAQGDMAKREVKASLLLSRIAEREGIYASEDEVKQQVDMIARQEHQPVPAIRKRLEDNGGLGRIANHIVTEKTLNMLFEQARKTEPPSVPETSEAEVAADE